MKNHSVNYFSRLIHRSRAVVFAVTTERILFMKLQQVLSLTRKAVDEYHMISEGDKIAVGISGGKDSLTLLYALNGLKRFYPEKFDIHAVTIDLGYELCDFSGVSKLCEELEVPYTIVKTDIAHIIFEERKEDNPCALCAKMRKGALNSAMKDLGCNKVAYGHHKDDIIETMLMSMIYEGRWHSFSPVTHLDRMDMTVIRPLMFMNERDVVGFKNLYDLPVVKSRCPIDGFSKREWAKNLLKEIEKEAPGAKQRIFTAILNGNMQGWPERLRLP